MLDFLLSPLFDWLHLPAKHVDSWSDDSSVSSSTDDCPLPFPSSVSENTAQIFTWQTIFVRHPFPFFGAPTKHLQIHIPILLVIISLPISTALVFWCLSTLPISVSWPHNIADLAQLGRDLHGYSQSGPGPLAHVIGVMAISAIWKHAWSIPGSVLWVRFVIAQTGQSIKVRAFLECPCRCFIFTNLRDNPPYHPDDVGFSVCHPSLNTLRTVSCHFISSGIGHDA